MYNILKEMFYFCGYNCKEYGVPNIWTRTWFNFIQANLVIESTQLPADIMRDIIERFASGVFVFHENSSEFDTTFKYDNLETLFFA